MKAIWLIIPYVVFTSFSYYFAKDGLYGESSKKAPTFREEMNCEENNI